MAQCSAAHDVTSVLLGGAEGDVWHSFANGWITSSELVAMLVTGDKQRANEFAGNRKEVFVAAWVVRAKEIEKEGGVQAYLAEINSLCVKYNDLRDELVQGSLRLGYTGNTDPDTWSKLVTDALMRFAETPEGQAVILETSK